MSAPHLTGFVPALEDVERHLVRGRTAGRAVNAEGGDPASHADPTLLARHLGHYLAAAEVAPDRTNGPEHERLLDVGCGTGAYSAWLAERLGLPLHLVDHDRTVLAAAAAVHDVEATHLELDTAPRSGVVTAMEVLEHVPQREQAGFLRSLLGRVAPGGVLVLSTPDESHYPGGWSGYAPHVGCVVADQLAALLHAASGGLPVEILRVVGGPYDVAVHRRWLEALGNRVWTQVVTRAPVLAQRVTPDVSPGGTVLDVGRVRGPHRVRVLPAEHGVGGSLLATVRPPR